MRKVIAKSGRRNLFTNIKDITECNRFKGLARKRRNDICDNSRYPHTVSINPILFVYVLSEEGQSGLALSDEQVEVA